MTSLHTTSFKLLLFPHHCKMRLIEKLTSGTGRERLCRRRRRSILPPLTTPGWPASLFSYITGLKTRIIHQHVCGFILSGRPRRRAEFGCWEKENELETSRELRRRLLVLVQATNFIYHFLHNESDFLHYFLSTFRDVHCSTECFVSPKLRSCSASILWPSCDHLKSLFRNVDTDRRQKVHLMVNVSVFIISPFSKCLSCVMSHLLVLTGGKNKHFFATLLEVKSRLSCTSAFWHQCLSLWKSNQQPHAAYLRSRLSLFTLPTVDFMHLRSHCAASWDFFPEIQTLSNLQITAFPFICLVSLTATRMGSQVQAGVKITDYFKNFSSSFL